VCVFRGCSFVEWLVEFDVEMFNSMQYTKAVTPKYKVDKMQFFVITVKIKYNGQKINVVLSHPFLCGSSALPCAGGWYGWAWLDG
jgi:hypothetical protein